MANRKEDEKNERIIRGLLKLPENRKCINCNSLFPSMASLHGSLPSMPPSGLLPTSGPGVPFPAWAQNQMPPYPSAFPPSAASALPARGYMGQQVPSSMPPSWHQGGSFGNEMSGFNAMNSNQHMAGGYSAPTNPAPFPSAGGNPFG